MLAGAAVAVSERDRHRDRGDQPQHPAPAGHRDDGDDAAPAVRRPLRARASAAASTCSSTSWACRGSPRRSSRTSSGSTGGCGTGRRWPATTGPAGSYPYLSQDPSFDEDIPVLMMAIGDATLRARRPGRGRRRAAHVPHRRDAGPVGGDRAALGRGRRPRPGVGADLGGARDRRGVGRREELRLRKLVGRLATYLQGYGDVLVRANGWDPAVLQRFREDPLVQGYPGAFDAIGTVEDLTPRRRRCCRAEWLAAAATGTAARVRRAGAGPVRRRRGRRHPARRDAGRAGAGARRVARDPARRAVRGPAGQPGRVP